MTHSTAALSRLVRAAGLVGGAVVCSLMPASTSAQTGVATPPTPVATVAPAFAGPDISGTWAQLLVTVSESRFPVLGTIRSTSTSVLRMEVTQDGDSAVIAREVCVLSVDSGTSMASTRVPSAFIAAIPRTRATVRLSSIGDNWSLLNWEAVEIIGMELANPRRDAVPTSADDPRVTDGDNDGNPGLTIEVNGLVGGDLYVAQRTFTEMLTTRLTADYMRGEVIWSAEQITLGASNRMLINDNPANPSDEGNYFEARRVEPGARCSDIRSQAESLFSIEL